MLAPQGDSGHVTFVCPRVLSGPVQVGGLRAQPDLLWHACWAQHEEEFKRTLMLNEIWQEDEALIPGR